MRACPAHRSPVHGLRPHPSIRGRPADCCGTRQAPEGQVVAARRLRGLRAMAHSANYFDVSEQGGIQVIRVKGERLRDAEILALVELIQEAAEAGKSEAVALDLSAVDLMSSVAV